MIANHSVVYTLTIFLILVLVVSDSRAEHKQVLAQHYDDGSEMNMKIIREFIDSEECVSKCHRFSTETLFLRFEAFR